MATIPSANRLRARILARPSAVERRAPDVPAPTASMTQELGHFCQVLFGVLFLLLGVALLLTLVLLPVGLPLALLGIAMIAAPGNR